LPHLQELYERLQDRGLEIIAVNTGDTSEMIQRVVRQHSLTFKMAMGGTLTSSLPRSFGVQALPTSYLIRPDGEVLWRGTGFTPLVEQRMKEALQGAGLQ
jgi:hypothetical protein